MSTKNFLFFGLFAFAVLGFTACESDPCADKDCGTGVCDTDGTCICDPGYEYDANGSCSVVTEHKFEGSWNVTDVCGSATPTTFSCAITHNGSDVDSKVGITNFGGDSGQGGIQKLVIADVTGTSLTVERQNPDGIEYVKNNQNVIVDSLRYWVKGSGTIDVTKTKPEMTINYMFISTKVNGVGIDSITCTAKYTGQ
jgi:hypothetical protein